MTEPVNPYAAPQTVVKDIGVPVGGFNLATRGSRFAASILDGLIIMAGFVALMFLTPWNIFEPADGLQTLLMGLGGIGVWLAVNVYPLLTRGQTVGKMALKIRVLRSDGSRASAMRLIGVRYVAFMAVNQIPIAGPIFSLVNPLMIFRESRRCLHDDVADTIVVKV